MPIHKEFSDGLAMYNYWSQQSKTKMHSKISSVMFFIFFMLSCTGSIIICIYWLSMNLGIHVPTIDDGIFAYIFWFGRICSYYTDGFWWLTIPFTIIIGLPFDLISKKWWIDFIVYSIVLTLTFCIIVFSVCIPALYDPWELEGKFHKNGGVDMFHNFVLEPLRNDFKDHGALRNARCFLLAWPSTKNDTYTEYYIFGKNILNKFNIDLPDISFDSSTDEINSRLLSKIKDVDLRITVEELLIIKTAVAAENKEPIAVNKNIQPAKPVSPPPITHESFRKSIYHLLETNIGNPVIKINVTLPYDIILSETQKGEYIYLYAICKPSHLSLLFEGQSDYINMGMALDFTKYSALFVITSEKKELGLSTDSLKEIKQKLYATNKVSRAWGFFDGASF